MGKLRNAPKKNREKLRVYGMLISGYRMQFGIMFPVYDNDNDDDPVTATIILQAIPEWEFDLLAPRIPDKVGEYCLSRRGGTHLRELQATRQRLQQSPPLPATVPAHTNIHTISHSLPKVRVHAWQNDFQRRVATAFTEKHHRALCLLVRIGEMLNDYGEWLERLLKTNVFYPKTCKATWRRTKSKE
jgi:hypothetical protein